MPRIPQDELDRLKAGVDLPALIRAKGIELKAHGEKDLVGRCPFHDDKTPSLVVSPAKGLWHCMGACQTGGDVVSWVMKADGVSFRHAVELLRDGKASTLLASDKILSQATVKRLPSPVDGGADDAQVLRQVVDYYHATLKQSPEALDYLAKRGLHNPEVIETFRLGYANRTLGLRLPLKNRDAGAQIRGRLEALGVFRESTGHEHLRGSLTIPILDADGGVLGLYGRKIRDDLKADIPRHLYLPGPHRGVFNPACLGHKEIILCEALIDALSFWAHGFKNVTCSYGVEGFTEEMLAAFLKHGVRRISIAYDRDEAGDRAAEKLGTKLLSEGIEVLRIQFPHGMDANDYIRKVSPPDKALGVLVNAATWIGKGGKPAAAAAVPPTPAPAAAPEPSSPLVAPPPPSSPTAVAPEKINVPCQVAGEDVLITLGERLWRVRGLSKNLSYEVMRVNLRVSVKDLFHVDQLDLYNSKHRESFLARAAGETGEAADVLKRDLGRVLLKLEELQEEQIKATLTPKTNEGPSLSEDEQREALAYLKAPDLLRRIIEDLTACGYVGEETNKLMGYLAATSRKTDDPLHLLIQSSSAAGKSTLMDTVLALMPEEDVAQYSALTGQALFYMDGGGLRHKILAIAEDGGMEKAAYALKLLMTEKKLRIAAPGKDPETGRLMTQSYHVDGPTSVFYSTTASEVDPELQNRSFTLTVDESEAQTDAILKLQRFGQTLEGKRQKRRREQIRTLHRNVQRLLKPVEVVNPFAFLLTFHAGKNRLRRDQMKYLGLMNTLALLHQHQRPHKTDADGTPYIEVTLSDIETANRLAAEVLGRSLDELAPQTRRLLSLLKGIVERQAKAKAVEWPLVRLSRFDIRKATGWGDTQLKIHLRRLVELEYLVVHRGAKGLTFEYELLYRGEGEDGGRFALGLIDVETLRRKVDGYTYDPDRSGANGHRSGSGRGSVGPRPPSGRGVGNALEPQQDGASEANEPLFTPDRISKGVEDEVAVHTGIPREAAPSLVAEG